ncbi:uncharacterized protein LOC122668575 [Telopea speciosissima]|uniref:uncharacterized protein LOC122668575 n=1 Tax=Telopea speciosissima TaxID=54955 RepID=UPI001CC763ED|nr:uncharacterized protein LOC122668575 [Telopea speciosissima]
MNFDLSDAGMHQRLQLSELEELRNDAYDNARIYKAKTKAYHDKLHIFSGKLRSRLDGPHVVHNVFSHGAVEILNPGNGDILKVNGQRLKPFIKLPTATTEEVMDLYEPLYFED